MVGAFEHVVELAEHSLGGLLGCPQLEPVLLGLEPQVRIAELPREIPGRFLPSLAPSRVRRVVDRNDDLPLVGVAGLPQPFEPDSTFVPPDTRRIATACAIRPGI